jgi:hypothetical protein
LPDGLLQSARTSFALDAGSGQRSEVIAQLAKQSDACPERLGSCPKAGSGCAIIGVPHAS